jgi:hypothetical protein
MRTLGWFGCIVMLIACAESRKGSDGAAGSGGADHPVAGAGLEDPCQAHRDAVANYVEAHRSCRRDADCQVVGACSGGFGFEAVNTMSSVGAEALSKETPEICQVFDGPTYEAVCKGVDVASDRAGECQLQALEHSCGEAPTPQTLCDGSSDIRLSFNVAGGFLSPTDGFTHPYGFTFFVIDGQCHYYASTDYMQGVYAGKLSQTDAGMLQRDLAFGHIADWKGSYGLQCADGSTESLAVQAGRFGCTCGCDGAPAGVTAAMAETRNWLNQLVLAGKLLDAELRAIASEYVGPMPPSVFDWPLSRAPADIEGLVAHNMTAVGDGALFAAGPDAAALRELRKRAIEQQPGTRVIYVRSGSPAKIYDLFMRDELPAADDAAIRSFLNH